MDSLSSLSSEIESPLLMITSKLNLQKLSNLIKKCNGYEPFYEDNASDLIQFSAYSGDTLVGFISCILPEYAGCDNIFRNFPYEPYAAPSYTNTSESRTEVTAMTHPDYRRRGVFTALFARLTKELKHKGYDTKNICFLFCMKKSLAQQLSGSSLHPVFAHSEYLMQYTRDFLSHHLSSGQKNTMETVENFPYTFCLKNNMYKILDSSHGTKNPAATLSLEFFKTHTCIHHVWVEKPLRQHGLATALVKYVLSDYFIRLGHTAPLILHVSGQNQPACALYQKCGFSVAEQSDYYTILPQ